MEEDAKPTQNREQDKSKAPEGTSHRVRAVDLRPIVALSGLSNVAWARALQMEPSLFFHVLSRDGTFDDRQSGRARHLMRVVKMGVEVFGLPSLFHDWLKAKNDIIRTAPIEVIYLSEYWDKLISELGRIDDGMIK